MSHHLIHSVEIILAYTVCVRALASAFTFTSVMIAYYTETVTEFVSRRHSAHRDTVFQLWVPATTFVPGALSLDPYPQSEGLEFYLVSQNKPKLYIYSTSGKIQNLTPPPPHTHTHINHSTCADPEIFMRGGPTKMVIFGHRREGVQPPKIPKLPFFR